MKPVHRTNSGQSLVEMVVAIGVVTMLVTGIIVATTMSLRVAGRGQAKSRAVKYTQEALELVRAIRNRGWDNFITYDGLWCLTKDGTWSKSLDNATCNPNVDTIYTRSVRFSLGTSATVPPYDVMTVVATVAWADPVERQVVLETTLTQWL